MKAHIFLNKLLLSTLIFLVTFAYANGQNVATLPAVGTMETIGTVENINIQAKVQSPSAQKTPLQIICLFEYTEGDVFNPPALPKEANGIVHVDEALSGLITELRKTGRFEGKFLETLLIAPPAKTIGAKRLLLIGLGNRNDFKPEMMRLVGLIGARAALNLKVTSYSQASDLKDAGISSPTADVAGYLTQGIIEANRTANFLKSKKAASFTGLKAVTILTGQAFFEDSKNGIRKTINAFGNSPSGSQYVL